MGNIENLAGRTVNLAIGRKPESANRRMWLYGGTGVFGLLNLVPAAPVVAIGSFLLFTGSVYRKHMGIAQNEAEKIRVRNQAQLVPQKSK